MFFVSNALKTRGWSAFADHDGEDTGVRALLSETDRLWVYDTLCSRGFQRVLKLVDFGAKATEPKYRNKRARMHGRFSEWLQDGDIPDDPRLETEIAAVRVLREDESGLLLAPKREIRQKLKVSPDGSDACVLCHAGSVRKTGGKSLRIGGTGGAEAATEDAACR